MTIEQIQAPIQEAYNAFVDTYRNYTHNDIPLLCEVEDYLSHFHGKQLRPSLLLLSAQACQHLSHKHILLATAMELLHNASLMHDDVVDESNQRRGHDSIRYRWGNQVAVLCGDYYLSRVMAVLEAVEDSRIATSVNRTVSDMCRGELKQLSALRNGDTTINDYIEIIGSKTASLMATCCELGAFNFTEEDNATNYCKAMHDFGYHYGIVFQIRDDINDLNEGHDIKLPDGYAAQKLIDQHTTQAIAALAPLPENKAKQTLLAMLQPSAPQP